MREDDKRNAPHRPAGKCDPKFPSSFCWALGIAKRKPRRTCGLGRPSVQQKSYTSMSRTPTRFTQPDAARAHAKAQVGAAARPPSYMSRKELAWELSCSESTVDELVRRGRIPHP